MSDLSFVIIIVSMFLIFAIAVMQKKRAERRVQELIAAIERDKQNRSWAIAGIDMGATRDVGVTVLFETSEADKWDAFRYTMMPHIDERSLPEHQNCKSFPVESEPTTPLPPEFEDWISKHTDNTP